MTGVPGVDKIEAAEMLAWLGLEALPVVVLRGAGGQRVEPGRLRDTVGGEGLMVRTAGVGEQRNLPRLAGVDAAAAVAWIRDLPAGLDVLVQPYAEVVYSVELGLFDDVIVAEMIPGIWELDACAEPVTVELSWSDARVRLNWPQDPQPATFHSLAGGYRRGTASVNDWQVAEVVTWIRDHYRGLRELRNHYHRAVGVKAHHALGYGLSPQNIRTSLPAPVATVAASSAGGGPTVVIRDPRAAIDVPAGARVVLEVSVAREDHRELEEFIDRLLAAGVRSVDVRSGLLSHLAINLRERGLEVHRADAGVLRP